MWYEVLSIVDTALNIKINTTVDKPINITEVDNNFSSFSLYVNNIEKICLHVSYIS